jgi:hypothetical protein
VSAEFQKKILMNTYRVYLIVVTCGAVLLTALGLWACSSEKTKGGQVEQSVESQLPISQDTSPKPIEPTITQAAGNNSEASRQDRVQALLARVETFNAGPATATFLRLDSSREQVNLATIPGGEVLDLASRYYAELTLDFDVTPRKVLDEGLWPFAEIPSSELDKGLFNIHRFPTQNDGDTVSEFTAAGSPEWLLQKRNAILQMYYTQRLFLDEHSNISMADAVMIISKAKMNPSFWVNPLTGQTMTASPKKGDFREVDSSEVFKSEPPFSVGDSRSASSNITVYGVPLREINVTDRTVKTTSTKNCCIFKSNYSFFTEGRGPFTYTWTCACTSENNWTCWLQWRYDCAFGMTWWTESNDYQCGDILPSGYVQRNCGLLGPQTIFAGECHATILGYSGCGPHICNISDDGCYQSYLDFYQGISQGYGGALPGPLCDCSSGGTG